MAFSCSTARNSARPWICVSPPARAMPHSNSCTASHAVPVAALCYFTVSPCCSNSEYAVPILFLHLPSGSSGRD
jgi:hypothetical protein